MISISSFFVIVGKLTAQPGKHIFFRLPIFPSLRTSTVTSPLLILVTFAEIAPSAINILFPTSVELWRSE